MSDLLLTVWFLFSWHYCIALFKVFDDILMTKSNGHFILVIVFLVIFLVILIVIDFCVPFDTVDAPFMTPDFYCF